MHEPRKQRNLVDSLEKKKNWFQLFKLGWITLSTEEISIRRLLDSTTGFSNSCPLDTVVMYPVDRAIQRMNNPDLV